VAEIVIGLGSNLDSPQHQLATALTHIAAIEGLTILVYSQVYDTDPVGPPQPRYLNEAVKVAWKLSPEALLDRLLDVEWAMGRVRDVDQLRWGPRVIDLDVLWSSDGAFHSERLTVPHPELTRRAFALAPLLDVEPRLPALYTEALKTCGGPPRVVGALPLPAPAPPLR
jgi:2-amino-4-hydroxy-6-hydroxymethyldihydropteridine diphosphokinase